MKVTSIKPQVKRQNRFSIFVDNKYSFSLNEDELIDLGIKIGQDIDEKDISHFSGEIEYSNAKNSCFKLLSYRARSKGEITDYLKRKKYDDEIINRVVEFLVSKEFLNDEEFAKQWIENRLRIKKASIKQIKLELRQKKVDQTTIDKVIYEEAIDETELIKQVIDKKRLQPKYQNDQKLMQLLARRGFSYDKILVALGRRTE